MAETSHIRTKVFVCYSHQDKKVLEELQVQLGPLERLGKIEVWDDTKIAPGSSWKEEISKAINSARVAILLVSANFLNSEFIANNELPPLLAAARNDGVKVLPVLVGACNYEFTNLNLFQFVNDPSKPLNMLRKPLRDREWANVAKVVLDAINTQKPEAISFDLLQFMTVDDLVIYGINLNSQGNYREAAIVLQQAWLKKPDNFDTWLEYAYALGKLEYHSDAINALMHAIDLDPRRFIASGYSSKGQSILVNSKQVSIFNGVGSGTFNHGLGTVPSEIILIGINGTNGIRYDNVTTTQVHVINSTAQFFMGLAIKRS